jgi:beta-lactamase class A
MRIIILIAVLSIIGAVIGGLKYIAAKNSPQLAIADPLIEAFDTPEAPIALQEFKQATPATIPTPKSPVETLFKKYAENYPDIDLAIDVVNLTDNKKYEYNADRINTGASTTKLFTASAFLAQLEKGAYTYEDKLGVYNTKFQLEQLVNQSNNISWDLFNSLLGKKNVENYAHNLGSNTFDFSENTLKARDITNYLTKLYTNKLHSKETSDYVLSLMQKTNDEAFVPKNTNAYKLYHKNGQLEGVVNEAVLLVGNNKTLALGIYTDGNDKWEYEKRAELIKGLIQEIAEVEKL